jgi:hypothetical protein
MSEQPNGSPGTAGKAFNGNGVSLREYVDLRIEHITDSTELARQSMEKRLDGMNEFRATLHDQASLFVTEAQLEAVKSKVESEMISAHDFRIAHEAKASQSSVVLLGIVTVITLIISVVSFALRLAGKG